MIIKRICLWWMIVFMMMQSGCFQLFDPGPNTMIKRSFNHSNSRQAIVFLKGGNATSGNSLHVSIKDADDDLGHDETGNIFTVDANHGKTQLNPAAISVNWISDDQLEISYDKKLRTFIKMAKYDKDTIIYVAR